MGNQNKDKKEYRDPFLQRVTEHWLDSSNELGYQPLFCVLLATQGYSVKYSIKNTNFEQGKDVVAVGPDDISYGFQLKGGDINLKRWRKEVKPEIEALIEIPIEHPDIDSSKPHVSYLVTNGEINDATRNDILGLNKVRWKNTPLKIWTRGDLLEGFQQIAEGILPRDAYTYKRIVDLIFEDGTGFADVSKIQPFLSEVLNTDNTPRAKEQRKRDIAGAVLYATMIAGPYREKENHASVVRVMVILLSLIFYLVDRYKLEDKYWIESYKIIWGDILSTSKLLETEVNSNGFNPFFTDPMGYSLIPFRKHSAISVIYPLKLSQFINGDDDWKTLLVPEIPEINDKYKSAIVVWGEASLLQFVLLSLTFKNIEGGKAIAINLIGDAIDLLIKLNGRKSKHSAGCTDLISPFFDLEFAVNLSFGLLEEEFEYKFKFNSHYMKPLLELMVRLGQREFISQRWQDISFFLFRDFVFDNPNDYYLWKSPKGEDRIILPKKEQSWSDLEKTTKSFNGSNLPESIRRFPEFVPFFLSVLPHRFNSDILGFLFEKTETHIQV